MNTGIVSIMYSVIMILRSLEGILDELRSDRLVDGVAIDNIRMEDSDDDDRGLSSELPGNSLTNAYYSLISNHQLTFR